MCHVISLVIANQPCLLLEDAFINGAFTILITKNCGRKKLLTHKFCLFSALIGLIGQTIVHLYGGAKM